MRPSLTLGIEEEYLIVDRESRDLVRQPAPGFLTACSEVLGAQVTGEYLQCQVEVGTRPHRRVDDAAAIAAAYQALLLYFHRLKEDNQRWRRYPNILILENRWQAQRHGINGGLIDLGRGKMVPFGDLVGELIALVSDEAQELGCLDELEHLRNIAGNGSSADRQRQVFKAAIAGGTGKDEALKQVVDHLMEAFLKTG